MKPCELCLNTDKTINEPLEKCNSCGFVQASEKYFNINPSELYQSDYYNGGDYVDYQKEQAALSKNFEDRLKIIQKYIKKGKLLEIGSAYGYFLNLANKSYESTGIECSKEGSDYSKDLTGCTIINSPFEEAQISEKYNLIVSLDTIEHVKSPNEFLKKCFEILDNNGYLFIETGDIEALLPRIQKNKWRLIHPPEHLNYFSSNTLTKMIEKNGFKVLEVKRVPFYRTIGQILYRINPNLFNLTPKSLHNKFIAINTYDLIFVSAQKV